MISIVRLAVLWISILALAVMQAREISLPFDAGLPRKNLTLLLHKKKPTLANDYQERLLNEQLAIWNLSGPIRLALPPMYAESLFGNAGFMSAFINHGEVFLYNEPYPHPKLSITEHIEGGATSQAYSFDNQSTNAAMYTWLGSSMWPVGYTAWYDVVFQTTFVDVPTPRLIDAGGFAIEPTAVRAIHPLNKVAIYGETTRMDMRHLSPIVWTFPREGRLRSDKPGFVVESIADGAEVSYLPTLPSRGERPFGLFLLAPRVQPSESPSPHWWSFDERFRRAVVDARPIEERRALLRQLAADYPTHPFLRHYRVIAELGGDRFDDTWLAAQSSACELPSWYLVAWTHLPWQRVRKLPCLTSLAKGTLDVQGEYVADSVVLAFRAERDDPELADLAERVVGRSFLRSEFRGFNYPQSNFAWLWLKARP